MNFGIWLNRTISSTFLVPGILYYGIESFLHILGTAKENIWFYSSLISVYSLCCCKRHAYGFFKTHFLFIVFLAVWGVFWPKFLSMSNWHYLSLNSTVLNLWNFTVLLTLQCNCRMEVQENPRTPVVIAQLSWFFGIATIVKLLLVPSYHSTDLEVHRHWLAITHSLPLSQWYTDETSEWTLDYPPFFAYFERFLSMVAHLIDPQIVHLHHGLNYKANSAIYFQRMSVIVSDLFLLYGVYRSTLTLASLKRNLIWLLVIWSPGLLIVDHLHFQYNGFLFGWLLLSLSFLVQGRDVMGGFLFAVLLCFKHLFAVAAPVYFVYLLRHYCRGGLVRGFARLSVMGAIVVAVFAAAYGPFVYHGQVGPLIYFYVFWLILQRVSLLTIWFALSFGFLTTVPKSHPLVRLLLYPHLIHLEVHIFTQILWFHLLVMLKFQMPIAISFFDLLYIVH